MSRPLIGLHWGPALSADERHADLVVDLGHLDHPGGAVYALVMLENHDEPRFKWRWSLESDPVWENGFEVASGYASTQREARRAVMDWIRTNLGRTEPVEANYNARLAYSPLKENK